MGVIIRNGIEYSGAGMGGGSCGCDEIVYLTQAEYDALPESKLTNGVEYRITDANTSNTVARNIAYDNSESGIEANSVQGAIDTMNESLTKYKTIDKTATTTALTGTIGGYQGMINIESDKPSNCIDSVVTACYKNSDSRVLGVAYVIGKNIIINAQTAGEYAVKVTFIYK